MPIIISLAPKIHSKSLTSTVTLNRAADLPTKQNVPLFPLSLFDNTDNHTRINFNNKFTNT
jgi:hypothetical protein